jgi:hypothetical protein
MPGMTELVLLAAELMRFTSSAHPNAAPVPAPRRPHLSDNETVVSNGRDEEAVREVAEPVMPEYEPVVDERTMAEREVIVADRERIPEVAGVESNRRTTESAVHSATESCAMHAHAAMHASAAMPASAHTRRHRTRKHRQAQRRARNQRHDRSILHVLLHGCGCATVARSESPVSVALLSWLIAPFNVPVVIAGRLADAARAITNSHATLVVRDDRPCELHSHLTHDS